MGISFQFCSKRGISSVITISLLLFVIVFSILYFQDWFQTYNSNFNTKVEILSEDKFNSLIIDGIYENKLYLKNNLVDNLTISSIKIGGVKCNLSGINKLSLGMNQIDISECINNGSLTKIKEVIILTENKLLSKTVVLKGERFDVNKLSLSCYFDNDNDGQILWTCAKYPMYIRTYEGDLDVNDNNNTIKADMSCLFLDDKNKCLNNFIISGCGFGTVLDISTNLCWQRDMSSYLNYNGSNINWTDAINYCNGLNLGSHTDWYLPSRQELFTIIESKRHYLVIVGGNNTKFINVQPNWYWTYSTYSRYNTSAWVVSLNHGLSLGLNYDKGSIRSVVCVRKNI